MLKKILAILLCANLFVLSGCAELGLRTNRTQSGGFHKKRPPRDNQFIAAGGYLKNNRRPVGMPEFPDSNSRKTLFSIRSDNKSKTGKKPTLLNWVQSNPNKLETKEEKKPTLMDYLQTNQDPSISQPMIEEVSSASEVEKVIVEEGEDKDCL